MWPLGVLQFPYVWHFPLTLHQYPLIPSIVILTEKCNISKDHTFAQYCSSAGNLNHSTSAAVKFLILTMFNSTYKNDSPADGSSPYQYAASVLITMSLRHIPMLNNLELQTRKFFIPEALSMIDMTIKFMCCIRIYIAWSWNTFIHDAAVTQVQHFQIFSCCLVGKVL